MFDFVPTHRLWRLRSMLQLALPVDRLVRPDHVLLFIGYGADDLLAADLAETQKMRAYGLHFAGLASTAGPAELQMQVA